MIRKVIILILIILIRSNSFVYSQSPVINSDTIILNKAIVQKDTQSQYNKNKDTTKINPKRFALVASVVPLTTAGLFVYFQKAWWKNSKTTFQWDMTYDWSYALSLDKAGHYWSSELAADVLSEMFQWAGVKRKQSLLYGGIFSATCGGIVEMKDAFAPKYGFSPSDFGADILGAFTPFLKEYIPFLRYFDIKWSYDFISKPDKTYLYETLPWGKNSSLMDRYERQNYYITTNISTLLGKSKTFQIPECLNIAVGLSSCNVIGQVNRDARLEIYLSLDWNLQKMNVTKDKKIKKLIHFLDYYHYPAPAIRLRPNPILYPVNL
ncbi:MAG: DUF2279 domain-containing protein [Bacteroidota bacterium]|nr:DUF2279 domain-containing protein [Bacteroidota bacterium]